MKKLLLFIFVAFSAFVSKAQVTFSPATFTAIDPVTITIDVTGTPMAGESEAYIWIFSNPSASGNPALPNRDGSVNGSWGNSSEAAKLVSAGPNRWRFTFTGTDLFNLTPAQLKDFGFLLKNKTGSKQTPDYKPFAFDPLIFTPSKLRVFPAKVSPSDVVTVVFDKTRAETTEEIRMTPTSVTFTVFDENNVVFGTPITVPVRAMENNLWGASFIPTRSYTVPAGKRLTKFRYKFNGTVRDVSGGNMTVSGTEGELQFSDLK
jgi:hypothetical protein